MRIKSLTIENFRGIRNKFEIDFGDNRVVLLTAPNGLGKTTILDAIEWGLTGKVGRLYDNYLIRGHNKTEQQQNKNGLLRNENAGEDEYTKVSIEIDDSGKKYSIIRSSLEDLFDTEKNAVSEVTYDGDEEAARDFLKKIDTNNFYQYHVCDIQKAVRLQSKSRTENKNLFDEFIRDYSKEEVVASNLNLFLKDIEKYLDETRAQKTVCDAKLTDLKDEFDKSQGNLEIDNYPETIIFENERTDINNMDNEDLDSASKKLVSAGYSKAIEALQLLSTDDENISKIKKLETIKGIVEENKDSINKVLEKGGFHAVEDDIRIKNNSINKYSKIVLTKDLLDTKIVDLYQLNNPDITKEKYESFKSEIQINEASLKTIEEDIKTYSKGNEIIDLMIGLNGYRERLVNYRKQKSTDGVVKCPVCGSSTFNTLNDEDILSQAKSYLDKSDQIISDKKSKKDKLQREIDDKYTEYINSINLAKDNSINSIKENVKELNMLITEANVFFDKIRDLKNDYDEKDLADIDYINNEIDKLKSHKLTEEGISILNNNYKTILSVIDNTIDISDNHFSLMNKIKARQQNISLTEDCSEDLIIKKLVIIRKLLKNNEYQSLNDRIVEKQNESDGLKTKIEEYSRLKELANNKITDIESEIKKLKNKEYKSLGPFLKQIYEKIVNIDFNGDFDISVDESNSLLSILDDKKRNLVNIMSNGQISAFMLSFFLAGIITRKNKETCKIYFMDDIVLCLDDINMLALLDMIKYQMKKKGKTAIDQLFISLCDDQISDLLKYKLNGSKVPFCEIVEGGEGDRINNCTLCVKKVG